MNQVDEQLAGVSRAEERQAGPGDGALLVERPVAHGVGRREVVVAEVAARPDAVFLRVVVDGTGAVADHDEVVKSQSYTDADLG